MARQHTSNASRRINRERIGKYAKFDNIETLYGHDMRPAYKRRSPDSTRYINQSN